MRDNEIIKALNYCCGNIKNNDEECQEDMCYQVCLPESREEGIRWCREWLMKDALDLINRQKAIIEKSEKVEHFADKTIETANAEIESLEKELMKCKLEKELLYNVSVEKQNIAIKEFAERLKEKLQWDVEFDNKLVFESDIDDLVKEMTEEEK